VNALNQAKCVIAPKVVHTPEETTSALPTRDIHANCPKAKQ